MIILIVETYDSNIINPSAALDNYFGQHESKLKDWLKVLKYSCFIQKRAFLNGGYSKINLVDSQDVMIHVVFVGTPFSYNTLDIKDKNIIIYPFDKLAITKNKIIKDILANQLSLDN